MTGKGPAPKALPVVLLVDDEQQLLESLGQELRNTCQLYTAPTAADAELMLAARRYDVIVCDHMMPGEQGLDFLIRVMEMMPSTRRILITGYANPEFLSRCTGIAGLSACLLKPVRAAEISRAILASLA